MITVFTPTYNRAELLMSAFESLCRQTCQEFNWLIVDDGSTDNTREVVEDMRRRADFEIKYYYQSNGGKHRACNFAVKKCRTKYFLFLDSDDTLSPKAIETLSRKLTAKIDGDENICGIIGPQNNDSAILAGIESASGIELYQKHGYSGDTLRLYKTAILKKHPFPEITYENFLDENVVFDEIDRRHKFLVLGECLYYSKYRNDGYTNSIDKVRASNPRGYSLSLRSSATSAISLKKRVGHTILYQIWNKRHGIKGFANFPSKLLYCVCLPFSKLCQAIGRPGFFFKQIPAKIGDPLISVVIPTHGRSAELGRALKSVDKQTYPKIEVVVVDDNAKNPEERRKVTEICKNYDFVKLIKNERELGGGLTRNAGIVAAHGELISFLDDDDEYLPERIEKMVAEYKLKSSNLVGLIYCSCYSVNEKGQIAGEYVSTLEGKPIYQQMLGSIAGTSTWLASKAALESVGMFDDVPSKQDSTLLLKLMLNGYDIFCVNENLVCYHEHAGDRISGMKPRNISGTVLYRKLCRENYDRITNSQIRRVEANFSSVLIPMYLANKMRVEAKLELKNMLKNRPVSVSTVKAVLKIWRSYVSN